MKLIFLLIVSLFIFDSSFVLAQEDESDQKSFMQRRRDKAVENRSKNIEAAEIFNKNKEDRQRQEEQTEKKPIESRPRTESNEMDL